MRSCRKGLGTGKANITAGIGCTPYLGIGVQNQIVVTLMKSMESEKNSIKKVVGEILSQLLNVPVLSGALATYLFLRIPDLEPTRLTGYASTILFLCVIPL